MNKNELKGAIARAGYNQKTLSKAMGMPINTLNLKVNGKSKITVEEAEMMCDILKIVDASDKVKIFLD
jgi:DNA-binding XRE family transcriptional regulator